MRAYVMLSALALGFFAACAPARAACDTKDPSMICGFKSPEDLIRLPGTPWAVASQLNMDVKPPYAHPVFTFRHAPLMAVRTDTHEVMPLFPGAGSGTDWDSKTYPACKTPPKELTSHGLNVKPLGKDKFRLFVVNHGERQSVEIVDVAATGKDLKAVWRGCLMAPEGMTFPNSVAPLPDGGLVLSGSGLRVWHQGGGWRNIGNVPGSNGVEISPDGNAIYVNDYEAQLIEKLDLDGKVIKSTPKLDFQPDNLRWGDDGALYVAGTITSAEQEASMACFEPAGCKIGFVSARVDPGTLAVTDVVRSAGIPNFGIATVTLKVGDAVWIGTVGADHILVRPLKK
jgi:hypothetical protein